jgi:hypothetical protein
MAIIPKKIEQLLIFKIYNVKISRHPSIICDHLVLNMTKAFPKKFKNPKKIAFGVTHFQNLPMCEGFFCHNLIKNSQLGRNHI